MYTAVSKLKEWQYRGMQRHLCSEIANGNLPRPSLPRPSPQFLTLLPPVKAKKSHHKARVCDKTRDCSVFILRGERGKKDARRKEAAEFPQQLFVRDRVGTAL